MIFTLIILIVDWTIMACNRQNILKVHIAYIAFLVIRLWRYKQPASYEINKEEAIPSGQSKLKDCSICNKPKPSRYYHCRRCNKCIYRMDHHCQWVNNCIGQYNLKVYLHLLINVFIHAAIILLITVFNLPHLFTTSRYQIYYLILFIPELYALYESYRLNHDFYLCVANNQTLIESFKKVAGKKMPFMRSLEAYMGQNKLFWAIPTFQTSIQSNFLEQTHILSDKQQIKQYTYADEYLYGTEQDDAYWQQALKNPEQKDK